MAKCQPWQDWWRVFFFFFQTMLTARKEARTLLSIHYQLIYSASDLVVNVQSCIDNSWWKQTAAVHRLHTRRHNILLLTAWSVTCSQSTWLLFSPQLLIVLPDVLCLVSRLHKRPWWTHTNPKGRLAKHGHSVKSGSNWRQKQRVDGMTNGMLIRPPIFVCALSNVTNRGHGTGCVKWY